MEGKRLTTSNKKIILPDFVEASISVIYRGASEERLAEVRAQCAEQLAFNEQQAVQRKVAGTKEEQTRAIAYMGTFLRHEDLGGGVSSNRLDILGAADDKFARFYTPAFAPYAQAAQIIGLLTTHTSLSTAVTVVAKKGPTDSFQSHKNRVSVWASTNGDDWSWDYIGGAVVTTANNATASTYTVGYTPSKSYLFVTVECNTFVTNPYAYGATLFNDVEVDCVKFA
jgi:hypothetical protein